MIDPENKRDWQMVHTGRQAAYEHAAKVCRDASVLKLQPCSEEERLRQAAKNAIAEELALVFEDIARAVGRGDA